MTAKNVGAVVVKDFGKLIGILTERDLLKAMAARVHSSEARVRQWMTENPSPPRRRWTATRRSSVMLEHGLPPPPDLEGDGRDRRRQPAAGRRRDEVERRGSATPSSGARTRELDERLGHPGRTPCRRRGRARSPASLHSVEARLRQRARGEIGFDRGARDERDPVACLHCAAHRLLQAELEAGLRDRATVPRFGAARPRPPGAPPHPSCITISTSARSSSTDTVRPAKGWPGGQMRITSSWRNGSNRTARCRRAAPTIPSSSSRSATRSTTVCVSCT